MDMERITKRVFSELGREKLLVEYHNIIHKLVGVVIDYINAAGESLKLSRMGHFNSYCLMLRATASGSAACQECDQRNARSGSLKRSELLYKCHAGLREVVVPLYDKSGTYIGCLTTGQFLSEQDERASRGAIAKLATTHKIDHKALWDSYNQTKVLTSLQIEGLIEFLKIVGGFIVETHHKLMFMEAIDGTDKIEQVKRHVEKSHMRKLTVADTARKFCMSPGHFCRFFKRHEKISFVSYLNIYRVERAAEMLGMTARSVAEIAFLTGFGSVSQFNRIFKSVKACSPGGFRRERMQKRGS